MGGTCSWTRAEEHETQSSLCRASDSKWCTASCLASLSFCFLVCEMKMPWGTRTPITDICFSWSTLWWWGPSGEGTRVDPSSSLHPGISAPATGHNNPWPSSAPQGCVTFTHSFSSRLWKGTKSSITRGQGLIPTRWPPSCKVSQWKCWAHRDSCSVTVWEKGLGFQFLRTKAHRMYWLGAPPGIQCAWLCYSFDPHAF